MPKQKQFLHTRKKVDRSKKREVTFASKSPSAREITIADVTTQEPNTANEYLAVGVDFEEAGEKWWAGDASKSLRFFLRATETYDAGLEKHPHSFDLAYNKARLQYEIAQQPRLLAHLSTPLLDLLQISLQSHRIALLIDQADPDLLFNTAQVLTSLAEKLSEGRAPIDIGREDSLRYFQEAFELLQRCFNVQKSSLTQGQADAVDEPPSASDVDNDDALNKSGSAFHTSEEELWASIEKPITTDNLLDTAIAQLDVLTAICVLDSSHSGSDVTWIEEYFRIELQGEVDAYAETSNRQHEAALAEARFSSAILDAAFRRGKIDILTYERKLDATFSHPGLELEEEVQSLCDKADAYLSFNTSVQGAIQQAKPDELAQIGGKCWKHITTALDSLTATSRIPNVQNLPQIHLRRGDCELLRLHLGEAPLNYDLAIKSAPTLLKNAEVYFRGAAALAKQNQDDDEDRKEAEVKEMVVMALADNSQRLSSLIELQRSVVEAVVQEMRDEELLGEQSVRKIEMLFT